MLRVRLLGQFDVQLDGIPVEIPSRPAQSLLAYLMLHVGQAQRRERLAGMLWPDSDESSARSNLRHALWRARKAIGADYILADRVSVTFDARAEYCLDAALLDTQPLAGSSADDLIEGVSAYAGELLPGFYDDWVTWERGRLESVYEERVQALLERLEEEGRWRELHEWAERWIAQGQVPEPAYRALMRAHAELGDQAGMAAVYQRCVQALQEELGVGPAQETVQLFQRLSEGTTALRAAPEKGQPERRTNLPVQPTPFIGRQALLAEIGARLEEPACRLLTLVGPGGCGKTRLALEAAARLEPDAYEHGVYFVSLAPLETAEEIVPTVAQALGFTFYGSAGGGEAVPPRQQLLDYLRNKSMLLVLDNFEHLLDGVGLVIEILQTAPQVKILATSRANLNLPQEHRFPIPGMDFPGPDALERATDYSAVKLFLEAARRAEPRFEANADDLRDVVRICRQVDGMPLGVLLAAGWAPMLSPAEIAVEIEHSLDFLETDLRGVPERQRSVRAVFDHSWKLLTAQEQDVLQQMSVFRGGFTRRAAQAVTGASLRAMKELVEKSLVAHTTTERYQVHELLRQYAAERLEANPDSARTARDRHAAYYAGFLARRAEQLKGHRQLAALAEIEADAENARAAWNWAVEQGHVEHLEQAMEGLGMFYDWRGRYIQGDRACQRAVERSADMIGYDAVRSGYIQRVRALCLAWRGVFQAQLGRNETAQKLLQESLSVLDMPELADNETRAARAFALQSLGNPTYYTGHYEAARDLFELSVGLYQELDDRWGMAQALIGLGWVAYNTANFNEMEQRLRESLAIQRALGDQRSAAYSLFGISESVRTLGQLQESERLVQESVAISRELGDRVNLMWGLAGQANGLQVAGKFEEARSVREEQKALCKELGARAWLAFAAAGLGAVEFDLGQYSDAKANFDLSLTLARASDYTLGVVQALFWLGCSATQAGAYPDARRLLLEGFDIMKAKDLREGLVAYHFVLADVEWGQSDQRKAWKHHRQALKAAIEQRKMVDFPYLVWQRAKFLTDCDEAERALELFALAARYPQLTNTHRWKEDTESQIATAAAAMQPDVVAAAQARGRARYLEATVRELLEELKA